MTIGAYLKNITGQPLHSMQFVYCANRSIDVSQSMDEIHYRAILQNLDYPETFAHILFVDFSLAFTMIIPDILSSNLLQLIVSPLHLSVDYQLPNRQETTGKAE